MCGFPENLQVEIEHLGEGQQYDIHDRFISNILTTLFDKVYGQSGKMPEGVHTVFVDFSPLEFGFEIK